MADDDLPPDADALYGLPLEEFVDRARQRVAKRLRGEGDREAAKRVGGAAQAERRGVDDQPARAQPVEVTSPAFATDGRRAARGAGRRCWRGAARLLGSAGRPAQAERNERPSTGSWSSHCGLFPGGREPGATTLERIAATLHAAAADEATREEVLSGRLLTRARAVRLRRPPGRARREPHRPPAQARARSREPRRRIRRRPSARGGRRARAPRTRSRGAPGGARRRGRRSAERAEAALEAARAEEARRRAALEELK